MLRGKEAVAQPARFLGTERFQRFRDAVAGAGARYVSSDKCHACSLAQVPQLLERLERAGFDLAVAPDLAQLLARRAQSARTDIASTLSHLARVEIGLASRGLRLFQHQREGVAWMRPRRHAALLDSMGLGKGIMALCALPPNAPVAVVCPAIVKHHWATEAATWVPHYRVRTLQGRHKWEWPVAGEIVILNYEILPKIERRDGRRQLLERYGSPQVGTVVIGDEAHAFKSNRAQRSRSFRVVANDALAADGRCWLLTGTPLTNRPPELWSVLKAAQLAETAFDSWQTFRQLFGASLDRWDRLQWSGQVHRSVPERLRRVSLYRRREDVLDLPPKMRVAVEVPGEFPPNVRKLLDSILATLVEQGIDLDQAAELVDLTKVSGAAFEQLSEARSALATAKIPALLKLIEEYEEAEEPLVVFSAHRAPIDILAERPGWAAISGGVPTAKRKPLIDSFQAGELKGIACTIKAGGIGITLTRAAHEVFVDLAWTPADINQAEDRCCRIGQTRPVLIKRLVADHELDRKVERILRVKQQLIDKAVEPSAVRHLAARSADDIIAEAERIERVIGRSALTSSKLPISLQIPGLEPDQEDSRG
jgi:SNF2 family DNA or RNA helicase